MPQLVQGKLLLGWMSQNEALRALSECHFDKTLTDRKARAMWKSYRERVEALPPRVPALPAQLELTETEIQAITAHEQRIHAGPNGQYFCGVIKIHPGSLIARQLGIVTDQCAKYGDMQNEQSRISAFFGIGMQNHGNYVPRVISRSRAEVDLPHFEFVPVVTPNNPVYFKERDRHVLVVHTPDEQRLVLWGGYHRTHTVFSQLGGDAAAVAPLLTMMRGIPEVDAFFSRPTPLRDAILGDRPPLLRDFFDPELFMAVNLRKKRAIGRVEAIRQGRVRAGVVLVNDYS